MTFAAIGRLSAASAIAMALLAATIGHAEPPPPPQAEQSDVRTLDMPKPSWMFIHRGFVLPGVAIYDTATGKMLGIVETSLIADLALDPAGKYYYVSETMWTHGWRGTRQDMVSVYDSTGLKLQSEIAMPGRILIGGPSAGELQGAELVRLPLRNGLMAPGDIVETLFRLGLRRLLIEGGSKTISAFIDAGCVDRLHVLVAPLIIGSGKPGLEMTPIEALDRAIRPPTRVFPLADGDVLFDCDLSGCRKD